MTEYDIVLVGGGHNGLVCASYLARSGLRVLVLEAADRPGGCAATREFAPGFSVSSCAQWINQLHPEVIRDLALEEHGLRWAGRDLASVLLAQDGNHLVARGGELSGVELCAEDRARYSVFRERMLKYARLLASAFTARPPKLVAGNFADRITLAKLGLGMKRLGREDMRELMRIVTMSLYDLMQEEFESPKIQALLSVDGVISAQRGPRSPGTVFAWLYQLVGEVFEFQGPAQVLGGMGALGNAMAAGARAGGVEIRTGARVVSIEVDAGRATGVILEDGQQLRAAAVVSNVDPVTTFERLVGYRNIETDMARRVSQIRCQGSIAKLHLALDHLPAFTGLDTALLGHRLLIATDMDYIERAFNPVKYNQHTRAPVLDISIASVNDPSLAPEGRHVLSAIVPFTPFAHESGWESQREPFIQVLVDCLERFAPGLGASVMAAELLLPADLEREYGMRGGHWHHGELALDQIMMMRPFPGATQYGTAVDGLYLCGAGTHPGGGLMGLAGRNAAREIISRRRRG